jgi:hypothetical protein
MSTPTVGARAEPAEAAVKTASPVQNMRRRPKRSPSAAPVSSEQANARLWAFTVHSRSERLVSSETPGSAVVTTGVSRRS